MSVAYIAGKITGDRRAKQKFARAARYVHQCGYDVVYDPANMFPRGITGKEAMPICIRLIDQADTVFFMPGWKDSRGANVEFAYCEYTEKEVQFLPAAEMMRI